jgi:hypothetical protein
MQVLVGIYLIRSAQNTIDVWRQLETKSIDDEYLEEKKMQYERIYYSQLKQASE